MLVDSFKNMNVISTKNNILLGQKDVYAVNKLTKYNENTDSYLVHFTDNSKEWIHSSNINPYCINEFKQQETILKYAKKYKQCHKLEIQQSNKKIQRVSQARDPTV